MEIYKSIISHGNLVNNDISWKFINQCCLMEKINTCRVIKIFNCIVALWK
jgi:hypothetical protein